MSIFKQNNQKLLFFLLFSFLITVVFYSCKKVKVYEDPIFKEESLVEKFFTTSTPPDKPTADIINLLRKENERSDFISKLPTSFGLPVWGKLKFLNNKETYNTFAGSDSSSSDIILPFTNNNTGLSGILMVHSTLDDACIINTYSIDQLYTVCHGDNIDTARATRELVLFFYLENQVFGTTKFYHIPANLFPKSTVLDANGDKTITIQNTPPSSSNLTITTCITVLCPVCNANDPNCPLGGSWQQCTTIYLPTGGGGWPTGPTGWPTGGGGGGSGNPTGGGGTPPCPGAVWYGFTESGPNHCPDLPPPTGGGGHGWNPGSPGDKLCSGSFNLRTSADNSFFETNMIGLKFEDAAGNVNSFSAYFDLHNGMTDYTMNQVIYPSPFGTGIPPKSALDYLHDFYPDFFSSGDVTSVWENGVKVWRFSKNAAQTIANRCSNTAGFSVKLEYPGLCAQPGFIPAQTSFRSQTDALLKCFMPTSICRLAPSQSTNNSYASFSPTCNF